MSVYSIHTHSPSAPMKSVFVSSVIFLVEPIEFSVFVLCKMAQNIVHKNQHYFLQSSVRLSKIVTAVEIKKLIGRVSIHDLGSLPDQNHDRCRRIMSDKCVSFLLGS